ncbi:hypothetical protein Aduo_010807 [Ancylostoma duodenale]
MNIGLFSSVLHFLLHLLTVKDSKFVHIAGSIESVASSHHRRDEGQVGGGGPSKVKKRAMVYHDYGQSGVVDVHGGRRGSSGSVDDHLRGSCSDEYRRRLCERHYKHREERVEEYEESQSFHKVVAFVLALIIIVMAVMLFLYSQVKDDVRRITQPHSGNLEVLRFRYGVMSENIDCSVHMKRRHTLGDTPHDVIRQGLMCLRTCSSYSTRRVFGSVDFRSHPNSTGHGRVYRKTAFGNNLQFKHGYNSLYATKYILQFNRIHCQPNVSKCAVNEHCSLCHLAYLNKSVAAEIWTLITGFFYSRGKLRNSRLSSVWFEPENVDEQRHAAIWSRSFWKSVRFGSGTGTVKERKFRIPSLFVKLAKTTPNSEKLLSHWQKRFPSIDLKKLSTKDTITITQREADLAASIFGANRAKKTTLGNVLRYYELAKDEERQYGLDIIFPVQGGDGVEALSFMTAFIIKVVYG